MDHVTSWRTFWTKKRGSLIVKGKKAVLIASLVWGADYLMVSTNQGVVHSTFLCDISNCGSLYPSALSRQSNQPNNQEQAKADVLLLTPWYRKWRMIKEKRMMHWCETSAPDILNPIGHQVKRFFYINVSFQRNPRVRMHINTVCCRRHKISVPMWLISAFLWPSFCD